MIPTVTNTWTFLVNQRIQPLLINDGNDLDTRRQLSVFKFKEMMKSVGFTVAGSSDTYNGGMNGIDRWITYSNFIYRYDGGWRYSWIVLSSPTMGQILVTMYSTNYSWDMYASPGSLFVFNSMTTRPTASDEVRMTGDSQHACYDDLSDQVCHLMTDSTLSQFRYIAISTASQATTLVLATKIKHIDENIPEQNCYTCISGYNISAITYANLFTSTGYPIRCRSIAGTSTLTGRFSTNVHYRTIGSTTRFYHPGEMGGMNDVSGECDIQNIGYVIPSYGRRGYIEDLWCSAAYCPSGTTFPVADPKKKLVQFGVLVFPWNGTTPVVT